MNTDSRLAFIIKLLIGLAIVVGLILLSLLVYKNYKKSSTAPLADQAPAKSDSSTTPIPLPKGKQSFTVNGGKRNGIEWKITTVDPYDPSLNQKQALSIKIISDTPVSGVTATLETDTKKTAYPLALSDGTDKDGLWQGSWTVEDTHNVTYSAVLKATNAEGGDSLTLTFR